MTDEYDIIKIHNAYLACAEWADLDEKDQEKYASFSEQAEKESLVLVTKAYNDCKHLLDAWKKTHDLNDFGHDLWLSRQGHGIGFWDRGLGELGEKLDEYAKSLGETYLYVSDENKIEFG